MNKTISCKMQCLKARLKWSHPWRPYSEVSANHKKKFSKKFKNLESICKIFFQVPTSVFPILGEKQTKTMVALHSIDIYVRWIFYYLDSTLVPHLSLYKHCLQVSRKSQNFYQSQLNHYCLLGCGDKCRFYFIYLFFYRF